MVGMEAEVSQSDLDWTVVRPAAPHQWPNHGRLPHHGRRPFRRADSLFSRADVAQFMIGEAEKAGSRATGRGSGGLDVALPVIVR